MISYKVYFSPNIFDTEPRLVECYKVSSLPLSLHIFQLKVQLILHIYFANDLAESLLLSLSLSFR